MNTLSCRNDQESGTDIQPPISEDILLNLPFRTLFPSFSGRIKLAWQGLFKGPDVHGTGHPAINPEVFSWAMSRIALNPSLFLFVSLMEEGEVKMESGRDSVA